MRIGVGACLLDELKEDCPLFDYEQNPENHLLINIRLTGHYSKFVQIVNPVRNYNF
ncbi:hypothetical protein BMS3Abin15_00695 [bacterium BMS3Abin15]|nr:hypothetical protein BMS3Abin15_00695 [bacterium BMS3Abin15]